MGSLPQRRLGASGLSVSAVGLGCMGMSMAYGPRDDRESQAALSRALDCGITLFDTAELYGAGHNETLLGKTIKDRRDNVVISTKFGIRPGPGGANQINSAPDYVKDACDRSLKALGTDRIDLYFQHRVDPKTPIEETVGALKELVDAGKVRHIGLCEVDPDIIRRAHGVHPLTAIQSEYSLWTREPEDGVFATCRNLGIGFVAYSPLSRGFLGGGIGTAEDVIRDGDIRQKFPRYSASNFPANKTLVDKLDELARAKGCTVAQLALAWVLAQDEDIVPIPGSRSAARVEENASAAGIALTSDDLAAIAAACPPEAVAGGRVPGTSRIKN